MAKPVTLLALITVTAVTCLSLAYGSPRLEGVVPQLDWASLGPLVGVGSGPKDGQGRTVALSGLGTTLAVWSMKGTVWVYALVGKRWVQQAALAVQQYGNFALSWSGDALVVSVGNEGWIYARAGNSWKRETKLALRSVADYVAMSGDGNTVAFSTDYTDSHSFTRAKAGSRWLPIGVTAKHIDGEKGVLNCGSMLGGTRLLLDFQGRTLACSYDRTPFSTDFYGHIYTRSAKGSWSGLAVFPSSSGVAALSADGRTSVFLSTSFPGAMEYFLTPLRIWTRKGDAKDTWLLRQTQERSTVSAYPGATQLSANGSILTVASGNYVIVFMRNPNSRWMWKGPLLQGGGAAIFTMAMDGSGKVIAIGDPNYNKGQGGTWVFTRK